jgi:hypothetical protein
MRNLKDWIATAARHVDECRRIVERQRRRIADDATAAKSVLLMAAKLCAFEPKCCLGTNT